MAEPQNLFQLLQRAANGPLWSGITTYSTAGDQSQYPKFISYKALLSEAERRSAPIRGLVNMNKNNVALLHVDNHEEAIVWFWSIIAAGGVPCMSTPFSKDDVERVKHLRSLSQLLNKPTIVTSDHLLSEFDGLDPTPHQTLWSFSHIDQERHKLAVIANITGEIRHQAILKDSNDVAVLMLTSGSTGASKAVRLKHGQILASVKGKSQLHSTSNHDHFMNWTGLDHVAGLIEIHIHALSLAANQYHIPGQTIMTNPMTFLEKLDQYKVSYTFAPNFFLSLLVQELQFNSNKSMKLDLSYLRAFISGGESNVVESCVKLTFLLKDYGAPPSFIRPGFGMTETCAGSIYSLDCPAYDISRKGEFACLGDAIPGIEMKIVGEDGMEVDANKLGELQVSGNVVFDQYHNDLHASHQSWTGDGWFRTGDRGFLDSNRRLHLTGRDKDIVVINGVNHYPQAIEAAIEAAKIPGVTPTYTVVFPHRPAHSETETVCVVYLPETKNQDSSTRVNSSTFISKTVIKHCGARPYKIIPLDETILQKSSLGKLSRSKLRKAFEEGKYSENVRANEGIIGSYKEHICEPATTQTEKVILEAYQHLFATTASSHIGINHDLFSLGLSSIDLLKLGTYLQSQLHIPSIPITIFFARPAIRNLAQALEALQKTHEYNPVVTLQPNGNKTPIFFIHPGVGEVLIFMNLSRYFTDRPVYALRARGFDGEAYFSSMDDVITTYHRGIKATQPHGPYAILGYSFGAILAFEIAKIMEKEGDEVKFLGTIDQPPHFKKRAQGYDWTETVMTISFFLGLLEEKYAYSVLPEMRKLTNDEVLDHIFSFAPASRLAELGINRTKLDNWAKLAYQLKVITWDYDPEGMVNHMDVFYTEPLIGIVKARNMKEWFENYIRKWEEFVEKGNCNFYVVGGTHRTLINPPHLVNFWKVLKDVLEERGL